MNAVSLPIRKCRPVRIALAEIDRPDAKIAFAGKAVAVAPASDLIACRAVRILLVTRRSRACHGAGGPIETRLFHRGYKSVHRRMAGGHAPPGRIGRRRAQQDFSTPRTGERGSGRSVASRKRSWRSSVRLPHLTIFRSSTHRPTRPCMSLRTSASI